MTKPLVIISSAFEDKKLKDIFLYHLHAALQDDYSSQVWDGEGEMSFRNWEEEVEDIIAQAEIVVLLVTVHLLNENFLRHQVMPELQRRHQLGNLKIFPVILRHCTWQAIGWLKDLDVKPKDRPVWQYSTNDDSSDADKFLAEIAQELRRILKKEDFSISKSIYSNTVITTEKKLKRPLLYPPPPSSYFVNRENELTEIQKYLESRQVVTLCGPSGVGKSALAIEVASIIQKGSSSQMFPDGVIYFDLSTREELNSLLEQIVRCLNEDLTPNPLFAAQRALAKHKVLLLLDGVKTADNLRPLLNIRSSCGVLITTQTRQDKIDSRKLNIKSLPLKEAVQLLKYHGGNRSNDEFAVWQVCKLVGGFPLAVYIIGKYIADAEEDISDYLGRLQKKPLETLPDISQSIERNLNQINETARQILSLVGRLARMPFKRELLKESLDLSDEEVQQGLEDLINYGIVYRNQRYYEISHALVHIYANQRLDVSDEIVGKLASRYLWLIKTQNTIGSKGYNELDFEYPHIIRVLHECVNRKIWYWVYMLVQEIDNYLDQQGHWTSRIIAIEFGLKAVNTLNFKDREADLLGRLGVTYYNFGQLDRAIEYHEQAWTLSQQNVNWRVESVIHQINLGNAYRTLGKFEIAKEHLEQALIKSKNNRDLKRESICLAYLGSWYYDLREFEKAEHHFKQALKIAWELKDKRIVSNCWNKLGEVYQILGQIDKAEKCFIQALAISQKVGDRYTESNSLIKLGNVYRHLGRQGEAEKLQLQARAIQKKFDPWISRNTALDNLEREYAALERIEKIRPNLEVLIQAHSNIEKQAKFS